MSATARRIVQFMLLTLVINAGWTFNKEAVADVWFDEQRSLAAAMDIDHSPTESDAAKVVSPKIPCNHWCHAVGHFVGIFFLHPTLLTEAVGDYFIVYKQSPLPSLPESHYRPPRLLSQGLIQISL